MAHKKAGGSSRNGRDSGGRRLGVKKFGGEIGIPGHHIHRQRGTKMDPGTGGDVVAECVSGLNTLIDYRYQQHFKAKKGQHGMGSQCTGESAEDMVMKLPVGTQIFEGDKETLVADLTKVGQRVVLAEGGK